MKKLIMLIAVMTVLVGCDDETATATARDGVQGIQGEQGLQGETGEQGLQGEKGETGLTGATGLTGKTGAKGETGQAGQNGKDGESCTIKATANGALITCANGVQVALKNGEDGKDGEDGQDGQDGKDGEDGSDGSVLSTTLAPVAGVCHEVAPGIFAKNEGFKADVYNNDQCSHLGDVGTYSDAGTICNNVSDFNEHREDHNGENCWIDDNTVLYVKGGFADMVFQVITYN